jgi:hypothetical protein
MRTCSDLGVCQSKECSECSECLRSLRIIGDTAKQWGLQLQLPRMLCPSCAQRLSRQNASILDVDRDCEISRGPFAGSRFGVRAPTPDETPLSVAEVIHALKVGLL